MEHETYEKTQCQFRYIKDYFHDSYESKKIESLIDLQIAIKGIASLVDQLASLRFTAQKSLSRHSSRSLLERQDQLSRDTMMYSDFLLPAFKNYNDLNIRMETLSAELKEKLEQKRRAHTDEELSSEGTKWGLTWPTKSLAGFFSPSAILSAMKAHEVWDVRPELEQTAKWQIFISDYLLKDHPERDELGKRLVQDQNPSIPLDDLVDEAQEKIMRRLDLNIEKIEAVALLLENHERKMAHLATNIDKIEAAAIKIEDLTVAHENKLLSQTSVIARMEQLRKLTGGNKK